MNFRDLCPGLPASGHRCPDLEQQESSAPRREWSPELTEVQMRSGFIGFRGAGEPSIRAARRRARYAASHPK